MQENNIYVYPNPGRNTIHFENADSKMLRVSIYNAFGQLQGVYSDHEIGTSTWDIGVYELIIETYAGEKIFRRWVKM